MKLNGIDRIKPDIGDYLVLADYGTEGLSVNSQHHELEDAIRAVMRGAYNSVAIVRLVDISLPTGDSDAR
jgi:hypothetical protein